MIKCYYLLPSTLINLLSQLNFQFTNIGLHRSTVQCNLSWLCCICTFRDNSSCSCTLSLSVPCRLQMSLAIYSLSESSNPNFHSLPSPNLLVEAQASGIRSHSLATDVTHLQVGCSFHRCSSRRGNVLNLSICMSKEMFAGCFHFIERRRPTV